MDEKQIKAKIKIIKNIYRNKLVKMKKSKNVLKTQLVILRINVIFKPIVLIRNYILHSTNNITNYLTSSYLYFLCFI